MKDRKRTDGFFIPSTQIGNQSTDGQGNVKSSDRTPSPTTHGLDLGRRGFLGSIIAAPLLLKMGYDMVMKKPEVPRFEDGTILNAKQLNALVDRINELERR
jgi:hypothetical protein